MTHRLPRKVASSQRGEGQIGCIITFLVIGLVGAAAFKAVPVLVSNNDFREAAMSISTRASTTPLDVLEKEIRAKAKELGVLEATEPGAVTLSKSGDQFQGTVTIRFNYTRKIDFYGVTTYEWSTQGSSTRPYMDAR